jgi:hypothetical protein
MLLHKPTACRAWSVGAHCAMMASCISSSNSDCAWCFDARLTGRRCRRCRRRPPRTRPASAGSAPRGPGRRPCPSLGTQRCPPAICTPESRCTGLILIYARAAARAAAWSNTYGAAPMVPAAKQLRRAFAAQSGQWPAAAGQGDDSQVDDLGAVMVGALHCSDDEVVARRVCRAGKHPVGTCGSKAEQPRH